jgi:ubiquinone/menaquinone biosynthesis C-methylase UbiE
MPYDKEQATQEFTRWSVGYDRSVLQRLLFAPAHRAIIARLQLSQFDRPTAILDVGCGTGVLAAHIALALPRATIWGVDLVSAMLVGGRDRWHAIGERAVPIQGDSERLPFASGSFDVVTCANSFHHYPHQDRAVAEMYRVLKPGGRLLLLDGFRDNIWGWVIYDVCVAAVEGEVKHASARNVRQILRVAGFIDLTQKVYGGAAPFLLTEGMAASPVVARVRSRVGSNAGTRKSVMSP